MKRHLFCSSQGSRKDVWRGCLRGNKGKKKEKLNCAAPKEGSEDRGFIGIQSGELVFGPWL